MFFRHDMACAHVSSTAIHMLSENGDGLRQGPRNIQLEYHLYVPFAVAPMIIDAMSRNKSRTVPEHEE